MAESAKVTNTTSFETDAEGQPTEAPQGEPPTPTSPESADPDRRDGPGEPRASDDEGDESPDGGDEE